MVSVKATQLCSYSSKVAIDNKQINYYGCILIKLYLQKTDGLRPQFAASLGHLKPYFCERKFNQVLFKYRHIFQVACSQRIILLIIHGPEINNFKGTWTVPYHAVLSETGAEGIRLCKSSFALKTALTAQHIRSRIPSEPAISECCPGTQRWEQ